MMIKIEFELIFPNNTFENFVWYDRIIIIFLMEPFIKSNILYSVKKFQFFNLLKLLKNSKNSMI
jgi:hypothetical protein